MPAVRARPARDGVLPAGPSAGNRRLRRVASNTVPWAARVRDGGGGVETIGLEGLGAEQRAVDRIGGERNGGKPWGQTWGFFAFGSLLSPEGPSLMSASEGRNRPANHQENDMQIDPTTRDYSSRSNAARAARKAFADFDIEKTEDGRWRILVVDPDMPEADTDAEAIAEGAATGNPMATTEDGAEDEKVAGPKAGSLARRCIELAQRDQGVTTAELNELTGWKGAPWRWLFSNRKGEGWCDKAGLPFRAERQGRNTVYHIDTEAR